ncbi:MAG: hypothetical protein IJW28_03390, partial [Clostridia bacterium]|nr:hypothetical protein [Clostridia bacterium]
MIILLNDREFLGASYDNIFNNVSLITNSTDNVYIVSSVSGSNTFTIVTINGNLITYKTQQGNADNAFNTLNNKQISYINYNNLDLLITLTSERLKVYDVTNEIYFGQDIIYRNLGLDSYITGQLASPQFMDIDLDKIYISDKYGTSKNIQSFIITDTGIKSEKTIVSSVSNDIGRFYNADDILYKDANSMYVADTKNNRIQLFNDTKVTVLDELHSTYSNTSPRSLMLDEFYNLYFIINIDVDKTSIIKYDGTNNSTIKEFDGNISDTTITYNNVIYAIDSTLDKVIKINDDKSASVIYDSLGDITDKAKIEYITYIDALLVYDNNTFTLLDTLGNKKAEKAIANINDYTVDHAGNIYLMTDSALYSIKVTDNYSFDVSSTPFAYGGNFSCYSVVSLNPSTSTLYFFNKDRQCVESFKSNTILDINIPAPVDAFNEDAITNIDQVKPAKIISDTLIYEYPYNLGNVFNNDYSVTNTLVIGEHQDYYYILFNNND